MALIQADAQGKVFRCTRDHQDAKYNNDPAAVQTVVLDESTNLALIEDVGRSMAAYTVVAGELRKNGQAVQVAADSPFARAARTLAQIEQKADSGTFADNTQRDRAIGSLARVLRRILEKDGT